MAEINDAGFKVLAERYAMKTFAANARVRAERSAAYEAAVEMYAVLNGYGVEETHDEFLNRMIGIGEDELMAYLEGANTKMFD